MESTTCERKAPKITFTSEFSEKRKYLKNVTTKTLAWYELSFRAVDCELDPKQTINQRIVHLRTRGISATSVNTWLRYVNAYQQWRGRI